MTLTKRQKATLDRHSKHHTPGVLKQIAKEVRVGMTFGEAHKNAPKIKKK